MPKRKSDVVDISSDSDDAPAAPKKARKDADAAPKVAGASKPKPAATKALTAAELKEEAKARELAEFNEAVDAGEFEVYDDCNEIRRKIRLLQKEPGFKITHWLRDDLGGVNSNSFGRFMKATGPTGGAENGTYSAAYVYFERRRIQEGKKKTAKRERNEYERPMGLPLRDQRRQWVWVGPGLSR